MAWQKRVYGIKDKERNWSDPRWRRIRWQVVKRDHFHCRECGRSFRWGKGMTIHHIRSRANGGDDSLPNLVALCQICHDRIELENYDDSVIPGQERPSNCIENSSGECWISGNWFVVTDDQANIIKIKRYYQVGSLLLQDRFDLYSGEKVCGEVTLF